MDQEYVKHQRLHASSYKGLFTSISTFENFKNCILVPFFIVLNENCSLSLLPSFVQIFKTPDLLLHYFHGLIFLHFWFGTYYKATLSNTSTDLLFYMTRWYSPPALDCPISLLSVTLMICTALCLYYLSNWNL